MKVVRHREGTVVSVVLTKEMHLAMKEYGRKSHSYAVILEVRLETTQLQNN